MPTATPAAALAAVHARLLGVRRQIGVLRSRGGDRKALGDAAQVALNATGTGTEAGCNAAVRALTNAGKLIKEHVGDKAHPNASDVAAACKAALPALQAIDWHVKPALSTVSVALGFDDVQLSATQPVVVVVTLVRDRPDLAASVHWRLTGISADAVRGVIEDDAAFPPGRAQARETVTFAPAPGLTAPRDAGFVLGPPLIGAKLGAPAGFPFRLLPPVAGPARPVVSVAQGFDAVALSADAPTAADVVLARTGGADALEVPVVVAGLRDGDLAAPAGPARFAAGEMSATVTLQFGPGTAGAPDRAAHLAIDASGGDFDLASPAGFDFAVREPAVIVTKARVSFVGDAGVIQRALAGQTTVQFPVDRDGSTHLPLVAPVAVSGLPAGVLDSVLPVEFGAGQSRGHATLILNPPVAARGARAPAPMQGRADLQATADVDLGARPTQAFTVVDQADDGGDDLPFDRWNGLAARPNKHPFIFGLSMSWPPDKVPDFVANVCKPACSSGGHHGAATADWSHTYGGPLSDDPRDYDDPRKIMSGSQYDIHGGNIADCFRIIGGKEDGYIVFTFRHRPDTGRGTWASLGQPGAHDQWSYASGRRYAAVMIANGLDPRQGIHRWDKEFPGGGYGVDASTAAAYGKSLGRHTFFFDKGCNDGCGSKPMHVLGLSKHNQIGPIAAMVPVGDDGNALIHAIDMSCHPASALNGLAGQPFPVQVAAVRRWFKGEYDGNRPNYAPDHADDRYSGLANARHFDIGISSFETLPRNDGALACHIRAAADYAIYEFHWDNRGRVLGLGYYHSDTITPRADIPGWDFSVFARLWKTGGPPYAI